MTTLINKTKQKQNKTKILIVCLFAFILTWSYSSARIQKIEMLPKASGEGTSTKQRTKPTIQMSANRNTNTNRRNNRDNRRNRRNETTQRGSSYLPRFNPTEPIPPTPFQWEVNGEKMTYTPAAWDILTYVIPRVHISLTDDDGIAFMKDRLKKHFRDEIAYNYDFTDVTRIDFVPLNGNANFVKAFVYHRQMTAADKQAHHERRSEHRFNAYNSLNRPAWRNMTLVSRITETIFASEHHKMTQRVYFVHNGKQSYWMLLPNLNPLTTYQRDITEQMGDLSSELIDNLAILAYAGKPVPSDIDLSILDDTRIETAWWPCARVTVMFNDKLKRFEQSECWRLTDYINSLGLATSADNDAMELLEFEMEEEDVNIEHAMEQAEHDLTHGLFPPPLGGSSFLDGFDS